MNQGKLEVVKQEMARVNVDILGISKLKWTGMAEFNSDDHYILEKAMAPHSSTLAWKIPWMEEPGRLQSMAFNGRQNLWMSCCVGLFMGTLCNNSLPVTLGNFPVCF